MLGSYSLYIDSKERLNRTFFALCISISIWAIGYSMANDATNSDLCLFWRRISVFGWGSMYSLLLHFCLVLTRKDNILKKWWHYLLLYTPAIITIYIFAISNSLAVQQYNFVRTTFGWTNIPPNNGWSWFFNIYFFGYMVYVLGVIWKWGRDSYSNQTKKQVKIILTSFSFALLLATATDVICNSINSIYIPQIAPIIILIPIIAVFYSIIQYGLMNPKLVNKAEDILNESTRARVYSNLSKTFVVGSFISFVVQYINYKEILYPLYSSCFILLLGVIIHILQKSKVREFTKDSLLIMIVFIATPSITLIFINFESITIWAFPFIFIVLALLFNKPILLTSTAISILSTQVLVWLLKPESIIINKTDFVGRIVISCIVIRLAFYVNRIYIKRLSQNVEQLSLQSFVSEISSDFINVNQSNINEKMNWVIRIVGKLFSIDRINIILINMEQHSIEYSTVWDYEERKTKKNFKSNIKFEEVSWLINQLISSESVYIPDVDRLPEVATEVKKLFKKRQIRSMVAFPILERGKTIKLLEFTSVKSTKKWQDRELRVLKIISNIFDDAHTKVEAENEINYMAYHDHLTGLPNRRFFKDSLNQAITLAKRTEKKIGVIFIDLDSFKIINDTLGHNGGDALLKMVSTKLVNVVRHSGTVSRFGGDEFLIMINNISDEEDIIIIMEKIILVLNQPFTVDGQVFNLTTSAGISVYPFDGTETDSLIKNADMAMYKAKEKGRSQFVKCSTELKEEVINKVKMTNSLNRALERDEFYLNYQPQVNILTGEIIGLEALIRWKHPELGFVSPAVFIPIAEQSGLINEIGEWVLKKACEQNKKWQIAGCPPVRMAVNVSANQLRNPNFVEQVKKTLYETDLNPGFVEIEITESTAMNETDDTVKFLSEIKNLGIMISIDDFGTDYSSLSRLKELPIDKIKIDKQFIDGIEESDKDKAIVRTIINLAENLDLKVIAEGVENENQLRFLKQEFCDEVQGYCYYRPMSAQDVEKILCKSKIESC